VDGNLQLASKSKAELSFSTNRRKFGGQVVELRLVHSGGATAGQVLMVSKFRKGAVGWTGFRVFN